ncbi:hypothetical protein WN51_02178 [Melipona quadrifasciata]|uniref:Uncharacterized protein n=1 Tax=Melipona quadrifasciata TaxID=166423 RepID=A0A0N0BDP7_9HYME|nr:hypothetical protein WN51_02178 [Melipona quadrifasciata]
MLCKWNCRKFHGLSISSKGRNVPLTPPPKPHPNLRPPLNSPGQTLLLATFGEPPERARKLFPRVKLSYSRLHRRNPRFCSLKRRIVLHYTSISFVLSICLHTSTKNLLC